MEERIKETSEDKVPAVVLQFILDGYTTITLKKVGEKWIITASN